MKELNKSAKQLIMLHAELLGQFYEEWHTAEKKDAEDPQCQRIAFHLLDNAGRLYRYTGDSKVLAGLLRETVEERTLMASASCWYFSSDDAVRTIKRIKSEDMLEDEDTDVVAQVLSYRDSLQTVYNHAELLAWETITRGNDLTFRRACEHAVCVCEALDDALQTISETVPFAMMELEGIKGLIQTEIGENEWWFGDARSQIAAMNLELSNLLPRRPTLWERFREWFEATQSVPSPGFQLHLAAASVLSSQRFHVEGTPAVIVEATTSRRKGTATFVVFDINQRIPKWVPGARLVLEHDGTELATWVLDESGKAKVSMKHAGPGRLALYDKKGKPRGYLVEINGQDAS